MSPAISNAIQVIEAELKFRIHAAAAKAVELANDVKAVVEKSDEDLQQAYNALRASVGLSQQEAQQAQSLAMLAAEKAKAIAIVDAQKAANTAGLTVPAETPAPAAATTLTVVPPAAP